MPYPYKKMDTADFDYIRSVTAPNRVKIGEEISEDYYHDGMPSFVAFAFACRNIFFGLIKKKRYEKRIP